MPPPRWPPPPDTRILEAKAKEVPGGFEKLSVVQLALPWWSFIVGRIQRFDLRVYFGAIEQRKRHRFHGSNAFYDLAELAKLVGLSDGKRPRSRRQARRQERRQAHRLEDALERLDGAGLLTWSVDDIEVAEDATTLPAADRAPFEAWLCARDIKYHVCPVPRRMVRFIAGTDLRPTTLGTLLAVITRSLFYHSDKPRPYRSGGTCKVSWIARTFDIDKRSAHRALVTLQARGLLVRLPGPAWQARRDGGRTVINLWWPDNVTNQEVDMIDREEIGTDGSVAVADDQDVADGDTVADGVRPEDVVIDVDEIEVAQEVPVHIEGPATVTPSSKKGPATVTPSYSYKNLCSYKKL